MGEILLCGDYFSPSVIAHECLHAILLYIGRDEAGDWPLEDILDINPVAPPKGSYHVQEMFCTCHTFMMDQILTFRNDWKKWVLKSKMGMETINPSVIKPHLLKNPYNCFVFDHTEDTQTITIGGKK